LYLKVGLGQQEEAKGDKEHSPYHINQIERPLAACFSSHPIKQPAPTAPKVRVVNLLPFAQCPNE